MIVVVGSSNTSNSGGARGEDEPAGRTSRPGRRLPTWRSPPPAEVLSPALVRRAYTTSITTTFNIIIIIMLYDYYLFFESAR
eukprot:16138881-Heterocapsa_arctica.AAC.1